MLRVLLEQRMLAAVLIAIGAGTLGVQAYPVDRSSVYLQLIELRSPTVSLVLVYGYAALWFTTPFFAASMLMSVGTIVAYPYPAKARVRPVAQRSRPICGGVCCDCDAGQQRVILLRRLVDGYTTFAEVYRYILEDTKIESEISKLQATLSHSPEVIVVPVPNYELQLAGEPWTNWFPDGPEHRAHQYNAELESYLHHEDVPFHAPKPGEPTPLPPLEELLESGRVLTLNCPVGLNPGLARALGVMLKLDFQRAVLQRIPKIAALPKQVWRDLRSRCRPAQRDEADWFHRLGTSRWREKRDVPRRQYS